MTLIKSLLLGSAAGLVVVAGAQAADLPTKKGAPAAEYVKVCSITVNGTPIVGFTLPGSDTCLKISGYDSAQYTYGPTRTSTQNSVGLFNRGQLNLDAASNTPNGPLLAHIEFQGDFGTGFDSRYGFAGNSARTQINNAYIQWAGLTAGKHASYFDFLAGGAAWDDIISPDHTGTPVPLIAYTAAFGGGFSATLSLETPEAASNVTNANITPIGLSYVSTNTIYGQKYPDIVGQFALSQAWGGAQLSGVFHHVGAYAIQGPPATTLTTTDTLTTADKWGYALLGGLKFNIPGMAGADLKLQGVYAYDAYGYSGMGSWGDFNFRGAAGEGGAQGPGTDVVIYGVRNNVADSTAYSFAGIVDLPISATFKISPEASYGHVSYSSSQGSETAFLGGGVLEWTPVKNLVFDLDLLYVNGSVTSASPAPVKTNYDGFNAKLRIERDF